MTFNDSILLPSQETLVQRLQHVSLYGQQLIAVTGGNGSGKTTLITSLLNELEEFSSALVTCPKHCDSSEIRRKILVQLFSEPVFDDDIPLSDTILRLSSSLPQSSFIVLDDAHYLPMELIAECIMLSLLNILGKNLSLTLTCSQAFFDELEAGLSDSQQETLLSINIDPLPDKEREALYYTLLSRSDEDPFTPREIVKSQLQKQFGTPQEVVNLLELSLNGQTVIVPTRLWPKTLVAGCVFLLVFILSCFYLFRPSTPAITPSIDKTVSQAWASSPIARYGEQVLAGYFVQQSSLLNQMRNEELLGSRIVKSERGAIDNLAGSTQQEIVVIEPATDLIDTSIDIQSAEIKLEVFAGKPIAAIEEQVTDLPLPANINPDISAAIDGYTIQIASVHKIKSLNNILSIIEAEAGVKVALHGERWIVLPGEFSSLESANKKSLSLIKKYQLSSPWVRQLKDIVDYERQDSPPTNEIPI